MDKFIVPILFAGITAVIVILGGLFGGVPFLNILRNLFIFSLLMGGIGFVLVFILQKWGIDLTSGEGQLENNEGENIPVDEIPNTENSENPIKNNVDENSAPADFEEKSSDSFFDYTLKDDEAIEFKPLDEHILDENKKFIDVDGEQYEYDPKNAAKAIRELLNEDEDSGKQ